MKAKFILLFMMTFSTNMAFGQWWFNPTRVEASGACSSCTTPAAKPFAALKSLVGNWQGKDRLGLMSHASFVMTGGGSALMSRLGGPKMPDDMISMFHLDNERLFMTHYCSAGNQPRMKATESSDGKVITFEFLDATNLASPQAGHMQRVVFSLLSPDHHTEEWTFLDHGKEQKDLFDLHRKK
jgi:hypothetical protein